jgi:hypothetical protein
MICSFTQTYANNRNELFEYHNKDMVDIYFRNKMDKNYYAFHNSSDDYYNNMIKNDYFTKMNNVEFIRYNNISYTKTLQLTLQRCKKDGFQYIVFLQDDVFSLVNENIINNLIKFTKTNSFDMLNLEVSNVNLNSEKNIYSNDSIIIHDTTSDDFKKSGLWAFDDGPYVANIDFLLNNIYDDIYYNKNDIWSAEGYINNKIQNRKIQRLVTNYNIFKRIGIVGPNAHSRPSELIFLNNRFMKNE